MSQADALSAANILEWLPNRLREVNGPHVGERPQHPAFVDGGGNEEVVAFVQLLPGTQVTGRRLTSHKRPCEIVVLDLLPAAPTGKMPPARC